MGPSRPAPNLPDPQGTQLEVSFRRLLDSCFKQLHAIEAAGAAAAAAPVATAAEAGAGAAARGYDGGPDSRGDGLPAPGTADAGAAVANSSSDTAAMVIKLRHYLDTLREQLADLRAQHEALGIDGATLDLYDTHVKAVAAAVPKVQLPPYCQKLVAGTAAAATTSRTAPPPNLSYFTPPPARPGVAAAGGASRTAGTSGRGANAVGGLSSAASARLREAEAAQALLTDELAELTAALKANAVGMAGAVADRGRLLDVTDAALTDSLEATKRNVATARAQVKRSGGNLCFTCMVLLLVGLIFTAMAVYIKFTHIMGYRARLTAAVGASHSGGLGAWLNAARELGAGLLAGGGDAAAAGQDDGGYWKAGGVGTEGADEGRGWHPQGAEVWEDGEL